MARAVENVKRKENKGEGEVSFLDWKCLFWNFYGEEESFLKPF